MKQSRYPKTISGIIFIGILLFQFLPKYVEAQEIKVDRIDGYGGFKFGMTFEEATKVRNDINAVDSAGHLAIHRKTTIYGYEASISVQFDHQTRLLDKIRVMFFFMEGGCKEAFVVIAKKLLYVYESEFIEMDKTKPGELSWIFPYGGTIKSVNLCLNDLEDTGLIHITYSPSEGL